MKRFVLSVVATGSLVMSPLFAAGPAFATDGGDGHKDRESNKTSTSTVCSNGGLLQLQVVCIGSIAIPVVINVLSGDNILSNGSLASNKAEAKA
jgi:hypothetical protein